MRSVCVPPLLQVKGAPAWLHAALPHCGLARNLFSASHSSPYWLQEKHVPHLADLQHLWELDLVSLHSETAGEHDLHDTLQPLTRLSSLRTLMIQVRSI